MKLSVEGTPEEIQELLQAIGSSKEQKVSVSNSDIDGICNCLTELGRSRPSSIGG
ncbi:TPA: hypothetical protein MW066_003040 [Enterococcus faecium]|uniref:hypothetical protein n=1 Tax=Enterococcus faecium TaxID=1352 RepID=UPI0016505732|nr:hypothetical protein [Enterococcus faecium]HCA4834134.1 hypothetical protein [Enterococcus faecium]